MIRPALHPELERLAAARYLSVTTGRTGGAAVAVPMRIADEGGYLIGLLRADSVVAEMLNHDRDVALAPCDVRGGLLGDPAEGIGTVLDDPALVLRAQALIIGKYGFLARLLLGWYRLRGTPLVVVAFEV